MDRLYATDLPAGPLDAAGAFHARVVPLVRRRMESDLAIIFDPADHTHQAWRAAAIGELAREAAPCRVNGVVGVNSAQVSQVCDWLASAPGVTGQVLVTDRAA